MLAMKAADSSKVIIGSVSQNVADQINEEFYFSGVGILTEATKTARTNSGKMYTLDLYQFEDNEGLISPAEALAVARSRPMTDTYEDGMDEYHVAGAVRINLVYKEELMRDEITITQVSAMTSWTGSVRTTKLVMVAVVSQGFNTYTHRIPNPVSNPSQNRWYSMQTDFVEEGLYNNLGLITDQLQGGANFYLSNGHSFSLGIDVRDSDIIIPYDHLIQYDDPWSEEAM